MNEDIMLEDKIKAKIEQITEEKAPEHRNWFRLGDLITINGMVFRVNGVKPHEIRLKLTKRMEK